LVLVDLQCGQTTILLSSVGGDIPSAINFAFVASDSQSVFQAGANFEMIFTLENPFSANFS
jgi:hypothetical protein